MFKQLRLPVILLLASTALIACGEKETTETAKAPVATASAPAATVAPEISVGMSEEDAIAKYGQPDLTQTRSIDSLVITNSEWNHDAGVTSVQFQNGTATFVNIIAK